MSSGVTTSPQMPSDVIVNIPPNEPLTAKPVAVDAPLPPPPKDVYKPEGRARDDSLLGELDRAVCFPLWAQYLLYAVLGTLIIIAPAMIIYLTSNSQEYMGRSPHSPLKGYVFMISCFSTLFYSIYLGTLTLVALIPFFVHVLEWIFGRVLLGARTRSALKHFLMIRHSFSRVVAIIPSWAVAKIFLRLPDWAPHFVTSAMIVMLLFFAKDVFIQRVAIVYHQKFQEVRIASNKLALKCLKKLRKHFMPKWKAHRLASPLVGGFFQRPHSPDSMCESVDDHAHDAKSLTASKAEDLSAALFSEIQKRFGKDCLEKGDLAEILGVHDDAKFFDMLDQDQNGDLTRKEFVQGLISVYSDRDNLVKILAESDDVINRLDWLVSNLVGLLAIFVCMAVFEIGVESVFLLQMNLAAIFYFFFQDICGQIFSSIVFVFVTHPFDTGDVVIVDGKQQTVRKIGLWYTSFYGVGRRLVYRKNSDLCKATIININRSGPLTDEVNFALSSSTNTEQILALEDRLNKFIRANGRDYESVTYAKNLKIVSSEAFMVNFEYRHKSNFVDSALRHRRNVLILNYMREAMTLLDIKLAPYSYDMPTLPPV